jgi:membrane associated rhomboid family serine protease/Flp pilus assembly protein TadD
MEFPNVGTPSSVAATPSSAAELADGSHPADKSTSKQPVVTYTMIVVCVLVYAVMAGLHLAHRQIGSEPLLLQWGANFGPLTIGGQWWRLLSSIFVHLGLIHLAVNMWCLWDLGSFAEGIYGRAVFLAIYLVSGVIGAIFSLAWRPFSIEAGASGAIFGVAGALIASFLLGHLPFPRRTAKAALLGVIIFAGYNLFVGFVGNGAGNAAHIGGFLSGLLIAGLLARTSARSAVVAGLLGIVVGCGVLAYGDAYVVPAERGRTALERGQTDVAIAALQESVRKKPTFAEGYSLLGQAYLRKQQFADAEAAYRRSLSIQPKDNAVRYQLGMALIAQHRASEAMDIFTQMAKSDPKNATAQTAIGTAAEMLGDYPRAMEAFRRATELDPRNAEVFSNLGLVALQTNQLDEAVSAFSKALQLQPDNPRTLLSLAVVYKAKGMDKEAQENYQRAAELASREGKR